MKHSENKAAGAHQQAKGLLDELEEVRRKYRGSMRLPHSHKEVMQL